MLASASASAPVRAAELSLAEQAQLGRLRDPASRQRYLAGRVLIRTVLAAELGAAPADISVGRDRCPICAEPHGRPVVLGAEGIQFSYSASGDVVGVAVASSVVGFDVELIRPGISDPDVLSQLHPAERSELAGRRNEDLLQVWTRKEAYLKALGTGLGRAPDLDYVGADVRRHPRGWVLTDLHLRHGYVASLCTTAGVRPEIETLTLDLGEPAS